MSRMGTAEDIGAEPTAAELSERERQRAAEAHRAAYDSRKFENRALAIELAAYARDAWNLAGDYFTQTAPALFETRRKVREARRALTGAALPDIRPAARMPKRPEWFRG